MPGQQLMLHPTVDECLSLEALAAAADLHPDLVEQFVAYGLLEPVGVADRVPWFDVKTVRRLRTICRLRADLGINLPGIAVVLDLLERIEALHRVVKGVRRVNWESR